MIDKGQLFKNDGFLKAGESWGKQLLEGTLLYKNHCLAFGVFPMTDLQISRGLCAWGGYN